MTSVLTMIAGFIESFAALGAGFASAGAGFQPKVPDSINK